MQKKKILPLIERLKIQRAADERKQKIRKMISEAKHKKNTAPVRNQEAFNTHQGSGKLDEIKNALAKETPAEKDIYGAGLVTKRGKGLKSVGAKYMKIGKK